MLEGVLTAHPQALQFVPREPRAIMRADAPVRSVGVAISPCTVPGAERPSFSLGENEMETGIGIEKRGKATAGQKTILHAFVPALEALREGLTAGEPEASIARAAREAALNGVEQTKEMQPATGRAKWFPEHSSGIPDPGAVSGSIIIAVIAEALPAQS